MTPPHSAVRAPANTDLSAAHLAWLIGSVAALFRRPFDANLVLKQFTPPLDLTTVIEAIRAQGLHTAAVTWPDASWADVPMPAIVFLAASDQQLIAPDAAPPDQAFKTTGTPALVVKSDGHTLALVRPGQRAPETLPAERLKALCMPTMLLVAEAEADQSDAALDADQSARTPKAFGFSWFVPALLRHKHIWRDVLVASLALQIVGLATPLFTQVIIDKVIAHQTHSTLIVLGAALAVFMLFSAGMTWLRQYLVLHTGNRIDAVLGSRVFQHLLRLPLPYFEHRPTGTLVARMQGIETLREFVSGAAVTLLLDIPFLFIFLAVMFFYSWQLSLIAVGILLTISVISLLVVPVFRERLNKQFLLGARNQSFLTEYVSGMSTVKSLQMEPVVEKRFGEYLAQYLAAGFRTRQLGNTYGVISNTLEQVMTLSILIFGALIVMRNDGFTVGMLVAFQMFASRLSQPLMRLVGLWQEFQQASIAVKRLGDILDMPQEPHSLVPQRVGAPAGRIAFEDVGFRYADDAPWLYRGLNVAFEPGRLTVVTGPSGAGKSTLAKLMLGFRLAQEGRVSLDGKDVRTLAANELRAAFGVVPQETVLFSGTVYDNLAMAHPHAGFDEIIAACRAAEIHDVIEALPKGYQTELGEHGVGLSGGQRQRIAIARALLKRPKVLLFDEAVSNLDHATAEHFAKTINRLKGKVTMIFITHQIPKGLAVDAIVPVGQVRARTNAPGAADEGAR